MYKKLFSSLGVLSLAVVFGFAGAASVPVELAPGECVQVISGDTVIDICRNSVGVTATPTETATSPNLTPTASALPTDTLTPSPTVTSTSVPPGQVIKPFRGAPACDHSVNTKWHASWDYSLGCQYDHSHNDDYKSALAVFEDWTKWIGEISYPHATLGENSPTGHTGYKMYVNLAPVPLRSHEGFAYLGAPNFVTGFWIELHDVGGNAHFAKPIHSYYMAARINDDGFIYTGGWAYFGCAMNPYKGGDLPLPGFDPVDANGNRKCWDPELYPFGNDPYRAASPLSDLRFFNADFGFPDNKWIWTSFPRGGYFGAQGDYNKRSFFFYRTLDSYTVLDNADPTREIFACGDPNKDGCKYNNTEFHVFTVGVYIPQSLAVNGIVNYEGYTNRRGDIVQCSAPGPDCVPLKIVNAPVGLALWARNTSGPRPEGEIIRDHDACLIEGGFSCIKFR